MRTLAILALFAGLFALAPSGCRKNKDNFCMENVSFSGTAPVGDASFTLPNGQAYSGMGGLPNPVTFGKYRGDFQSVVTKQTPTATGMDVELVHYFDDGKGNAFWTSDKATFTPLDTTFTRFQVYDVMTIVDGTGDFKCASGEIINQGPANFAAGTLEVNITGKICGGCD
ncbi:MAG: hypothetical protein J5I98_24060 [Phaeodactylibacter sp.]|nr:hypothetical protein [Phaeodactylibacter sp.]